MKIEPIETVILLHDPKELAIALERFPPGREILYCTLSPHASDQCEKEGVDYVPLEEFGFNEDPKKLRDNVHERLLKTITVADQITQKYHPKRPYISPYRASFRRLIVLFAGTRIRIHYISSLIAKTKAKRIVWFGKPAKVLDHYSGSSFSDTGSVEIALLKFQQWGEIELIDHSAEICKGEKNGEQGFSEKNFKQEALNFLKKMGFVNSLKFQIKMLKTSSRDIIKSYLISSKDHILIENYTPFWLSTCKLLLRRGIKIHNAKDYTSFLESWKSSNSPLEKELREALLASAVFQWEGMDWIEFMFPLIRHLSSLTDPLNKVAQETESQTRKHKIKCVLTIGAHRAHKYALIQGAKMAGAKVVTYQHGGFGPSGGPFMGYDDVDISDFHICAGPGDVDLHKKFNPQREIKCRPLGFLNSNSAKESISAEEKTQKISSPKKQQTLLYITSHFCLSGGILLEFEHPWIDSLVYKNQKSIVLGLKKIMKNFVEFKTILKLHPIEERFNIPSMGKDFEEERFSIIHQELDTQNLLSASDIILVDTPSTTLIQSVITRKPLFVLNSHLKLYPKAKELLEKRAVIREDPDELINALKDFFLKNSYPADINNTEFLRSFSDPFGDGRLFERAADLVVEACSKSDLNY